MLSIFEKIWSMSVTASVVIAVVLIARLLLRKAPKVLSYALWAVVLIRLLCPFRLESPISLIPEPAIEAKAPEVSFELPAAQQSSEHVQNGSDFVLSVPEDFPMETLAVPEEMIHTFPVEVIRPAQVVAPKVQETFRFPVEWVWFSGAVLLALVSVVRYRLLRRKLRLCVPVRENIYLADGIPSAFVLGLLRPRIYLPSGLSEGEWDYVLAHERCHIRRGDPLIRLLSFTALCLHWFNPLVWLAFYLAGQDMEMSCDEAVVRTLGESIRGDYSQTLLDLSTGRKTFAFTPLAFGEGDTGKRIRNLGKWKKPVIWIVVIAAILCTVLAICLLTDPKQEKKPDSEDATHAPALNINAPLPSTNVSIPEGEFSYPFYGVPAVEWEGRYDEKGTITKQLAQLPGITFLWDDEGYLQMESEGTVTELHIHGEQSEKHFCSRVLAVFFADLTGDGVPEVCSTGSLGNGISYTTICVYDAVRGEEYLLTHSPNDSYQLLLVDGYLWVYESIYEFGGEYSPGAYGPLTLLTQGDTMVPVILDKSDWHYEMAPTTSSMSGGYDGYLFVEINGRNYRYRRRNTDPQGLTPDVYLGTYYENTIASFDTRNTYRVYSTKEYTDHTVLLVEVDGWLWMSYYYAPAQRISESTWESVRNTEGLVVLEDGKVTSGKEYFLSFAEKTWAGEACAIQTASYYTLDPDTMVDHLYQTMVEDYPSLYVHTLSYDGEYYTITWEENGEVITKQFRHLMHYIIEPQWSGVGYTTRYIRYVLTNDDTVTWDDIFHGMISSQFGAYIDHYTVYTDYLIE